MVWSLLIVAQPKAAEQASGTLAAAGPQAASTNAATSTTNSTIRFISLSP
jgi:hypothetical protein